MEEECAKRGLPVKIRNAEPYREFQNSEDNDRYYGMNEGYWRNQAVNPLNLPQGPAPQVVQVRYRPVMHYLFEKGVPEKCPFLLR